MGVRDHRPQLEDVNPLTSLPNTLLPKKWLTRRIDTDRSTCNSYGNSQHQAHPRAKHNVKNSLCYEVANATFLGSSHA